MRVLRLKQVIEKVGWSHMTIFRKERVGVFPKKIQLGPNSIGYLEEEIDNFILQRKNERDAKLHSREGK
jgi:prophage regulatory protein